MSVCGCLREPVSIFLGQLPRSTVARVYGKCVLNWTRNRPTVCQSGRTIFTPTTVLESSSRSVFSSALDFVRISFYFNHFNRFILVILFRQLYFAFPWWLMMLKSSLVLICHSYILFCELSVSTFHPLSNECFSFVYYQV